MNVVFETSKMVILKPAQIASLGDSTFHTLSRKALSLIFVSFLLMYI
jgi:hypothetical protein